MRSLILAAALMVSACGGKSSPGTPVGPSPTVPNVAGIWRGTDRTTSITGGECVSVTLQPSVGGASPITLTVTQNGSIVSATYVDLTSGITVDFTGTASNSAMSLNGTFSSAARILGFRCSNGALRDLIWQTGVLTVTVSGNRLTGESVLNFNTSSSTTGAALGTFIARGALDLTR